MKRQALAIPMMVFGAALGTAVVVLAAPPEGAPSFSSILSQRDLAPGALPGVIAQNLPLRRKYRLQILRLRDLAIEVESGRAAPNNANSSLECMSRAAFRTVYELDRKFLKPDDGFHSSKYLMTDGDRAASRARYAFLVHGLQDLKADFARLNYDLFARGHHPGSEEIEQLLVQYPLSTAEDFDQMKAFTAAVENFVYNLLDASNPCRLEIPEIV